MAVAGTLSKAVCAAFLKPNAIASLSMDFVMQSTSTVRARMCFARSDAPFAVVKTSLERLLESRLLILCARAEIC